MQEKSLAVNVFDEGNSSSQQVPEQRQTQSETNNQLKTKDGEPFTKQVTDTSGGPGITSRSDDGTIGYMLWVGAGIVFAVILIALFVIIRKLNKKK